jgi:hypothetical protein
MATKAEIGKYVAQRYESDFGDAGNQRENLEFPRPSQAQSGAEQCAYPNDSIPAHFSEETSLGKPLSIDGVANLLGCSVWTVRQRYLRQGLPYLQARPRGKLVFFREQIIAWIQKRQRQKGGILR